MLRTHVAPGVTPLALDALAEAYITERGGRPAFKGYLGFPASICTSIDDVCVHGIPTDEPLVEGQIISLDCGVVFSGMHTDACITVPVGRAEPLALHLIATAEEALKQGIAAIRAGCRVGDISAAVEAHVRAAKCHVIPYLCGHGLGSHVHQAPDVPNTGRAGSGPLLPAGTLIAIEPIIALGTGRVVQDDDGWSIRSADGSLTAHAEHTVLVTERGAEIMA
jgi:methionyl aminopeptidase